MKLPLLREIKVAAVLVGASLLLGCEAPQSTASEQGPPVYPALTSAPAPDLVTVTPVTNAPTAPSAPAEAQSSSSTNAAQASPAAEPPAEKTSDHPVELSARLQEIVKLAESGVGDDVILAFIQNSPEPFNPTPEEIVYLTDLGISDVIITALVNHRATQAPVAQEPAPPTTNAPAVVQMPAPTEAVPTYNPEPPIYTQEPQEPYAGPPVVQYVTPPPVVEYNYFYSSLNPYGSWIDLPDYGWCWQPTVAVIHHDWRPYSDRGRWLYSDLGWYWQSDYSWGWAPFHYGRWFHHPFRGWCWWPDRVWGPAWVSWRYTDNYCGWAPLPPGARYHSGVGFTYYGANVGLSFNFGLHRDAWTFVPAHRFHDREVWRHRLATAEQVNVYQHSRVINNYTVVNNTIINRGVSDHVPALARSEPRRVVVREIPERATGVIRPDRLHQEGSNLIVYRPKLPSTDAHSFRSFENGANSRVASRTLPSPAPAPQAATQPRNEPRGPASQPRGRAQSPARDVSGSSFTHREAPNTQAGSSSRAERPIGSWSGVSPGSAAPRVEPARPMGGSRSTPTPGSQLAPRTSSQPSTVPSQPTRRPGPGTVLPSRSRSVPQAAPQPQSATSPRQEPRSTMNSPQRLIATRPAAPQPESVPPPSQASAPSWRQFRTFSEAQNSAVPHAAPAPTPSFRREVARPQTTVTPEKFQALPMRRSFDTLRRVEPAPQIEASPSFRSAPTPTPNFSLSPQPGYSAPPPTRSVPSYTPPAVQSRPAPSFSLPASRPAPQAAPAPRPARSNSRRN